MITRIVKLTFRPENVSDFLKVFQRSNKYISSFEGCSHLELLKDKSDECIFFTYSIWESEAHLNKYRNSELFNRTWGKAKKFFSEPAMAWTLNKEFTT